MGPIAAFLLSSVHNLYEKTHRTGAFFTFLKNFYASTVVVDTLTLLVEVVETTVSGSSSRGSSGVVLGVVVGTTN